MTAPNTDVFGPANFTLSSTNRPFDGRQFTPTDTWFVDCTTSTSGDGTFLGAPWFNTVTANMRAIARANGTQADGITPVVKQDNGDDLMLRAIAAMVQRGQLLWAVDQGVPNVVLITPSFPLAEIVAGTPFLVQMANDITGPATLRVGTFPPFQFLKSGGQQFTGGEIRKGDPQWVAYDGIAMRAIGVGGGSAPQLVVADLVMTVPEQYPTVRAALLASSSMCLRSDAHLKIYVDQQGYKETWDSTLGPLIGNHPYGQRISIEALPLTIGFPSGDDVDSKSASAVQQMLQSRFAASFIATNGANVLEIRAGTLNFSNFLFLGDGSAGQQGPSVGPWQTTASQGNLGLTSCAVHNFGGDNIQVTDGSVLRTNNLCSTYAGLAALRSARNASTTMRTGALVAMYSTLGLAAIGGQIRIDSGAGRVDASRNLNFGMQATGKGVIGISTGPAVNIRNNGNFGTQGYDGNIILPASTVWGGNANGDCYAAENGLVDVRGGNPGYTSLYRNTFGGNQNGQVLV